MEPDRQIKKIKDNVWKLEQSGINYSVKKYHSMSKVTKVKYIHEALHSIDYKHIVPVVDNEEPLTFIQPWLDGAKAVNFKKRADRTDSLAALHRLHETSHKIDWHASRFLHPYPLITKWEDRILRFHELSGQCEAYIGKGRVDEIQMYAVNALSIIKKQYIDPFHGTLLHGDIVHHNILRDEKGFIRFIDFDLACTGPPGTEIALWIHRVLPNISYDINFLFDEQPLLRKLDHMSTTLLLFPNELLREWLHFFTLSSSGKVRQAKHLIPFTQSALSHWPKLWYDVERINI